MNNEKLWAMSLLVIGVISLFIAISNIAGIALPVIAKRILGIVELIVLPVFVYATVRKFRK